MKAIIFALINSVMSIVILGVIQILVFIYGWGLTPHNWKIIIGGWIGSMVLTVMTSMMLEAAKKG